MRQCWHSGNKMIFFTKVLMTEKGVLSLFFLRGHLLQMGIPAFIMY